MATVGTHLHQAHELGQSIWYDNLRRGLLRSGALAGLVDRGVKGLTSNPTIFGRAIVASSGYEEALRNAQALGDLQVPRRRRRRALRVHLCADVDSGLKLLAEAMASRRR